MLLIAKPFHTVWDFWECCRCICIHSTGCILLFHLIIDIHLWIVLNMDRKVRIIRIYTAAGRKVTPQAFGNLFHIHFSVLGV